jgi:hypothetical protein
MRTANKFVTQSYLAWKPLPGSVELQWIEPGAEPYRFPDVQYIATGKLGKQAGDVFKDPVRALQDFANCGEDERDILRFTKQYGPLRERYVDSAPFPSPQDQTDYVRTGRIEIPCLYWREDQTKFRQLWQQAGQGGNDAAGVITRELNLKRDARLGPFPELRVMVVPHHCLSVSVVPGDLWQSLCLMLVNHADRLRMCENAGSGESDRQQPCPAPYFVAGRKGQRYCTERCARLAANRNWWEKHGKEWREQHRKQAQGTKGEQQHRKGGS